MVTPKNEVDKAFVELAMWCATMEQKQKHKATVVSKLFTGTKMPFTKQVTDYQLPNKFKSSLNFELQWN